jgi:hypothetical protein
MIKIRKNILNLIFAIILIISTILKYLYLTIKGRKFKFNVLTIVEIILIISNIGLVIEGNFLPEE